MNLNYIILAHKNPNQLKRLIKKLSGPDIYFYIHIDKNVDVKPFLEETKFLSNITFLSDEKREIGTWGDIGIVKATINAMIEIVDSQKKGYTILLSGQDYPIKDNDYIYAYLKNNYGTNFIDTFGLPSESLKFMGLDRINRFKVNLSNKRGHYVQLYSVLESKFYKKSSLKNIIELFKHNKYHFLLSIFVKRKFPKYTKPYVGSQWWAITTEMLKEIIQFLEKNPGYIKYHKYSLLPDEMFFQSIIMSLVEKNPVLSIKNSLTYVNWSRKNCELPVTFDISDFDELTEQEDNKLYARKFDIEIDENILNKIDILHSK